MMCLENSIQNCLNDIRNSKNVNVKKKKTDEILDYLQSKEVIALIGRCSVNNQTDSLSWSCMFRVCHNEILQVCEKINEEIQKKKSAASFNTFKMKLGNLFITIVREASKSGNCYVTGSELAQAVLKVFENGRLCRDQIGDIYLQALQQWILPNWKYWPDLKEYWNDLYESLQRMYSDNHYEQSSSILAALNLVVLHGCQHSTLALTVKKQCFTFLERVIGSVSSPGSSSKLQLHAVTLTRAICNELKKESRLAICAFSERVLDNVLKLYEMRAEKQQKKKLALFSLLSLFVMVHHPMVEREEDEAKLTQAHQWPKWKMKLRKIWSIVVVKEVHCMQKFARFNGDGPHPDFLRLAVQVMKQVCFNDDAASVSSYVYSANMSGASTVENTLSECSAAKRMRPLSAFSDVVEELKQTSEPFAVCPWLCVLSSVFSTYPYLLKERDYIALLDVLVDHLRSSKNPLLSEYLCRCCSSMLSVRQVLVKNGIAFDNSEMSYWNCVWDIVVRMAGLNQNAKCSHYLLRKLIEGWFWKPPMMTSLLRLYLTGASLLFSDHSLLTLHRLRVFTGSFPENIYGIAVRDSLLNWLLPMKEFTAIEEFDGILLPAKTFFAHLTVLLIVKSNIYNNHNHDDDDAYYGGVPVAGFCYDDSSIDAISSFYSLLCLHPKSYDKKKNCHLFLQPLSGTAINAGDDSSSGEKNHSVVGSSKYFLINREMANKLTEVLVHYGTCLLNICSGEELRSDVSPVLYLRHFAEILSHTIVYYERYVNESNDRLKAHLCDEILPKFIECGQRVVIDENLPDTCRENAMNNFQNFFQTVSTLPPQSIAHVISDNPLWNEFLALAFKIATNSGKSEAALATSIPPDDADFADATHTVEGACSVFDKEALNDGERFQIQTFDTLLHYSHHHRERTQYQIEMLTNVVEHFAVDTDLVYSSVVTLHMVASLLREVLHLGVNELQRVPGMLVNATEVIKRLCEQDEWYKVSETAAMILRYIRDFIPIAFATNNDEALRNLMVLVYGFHNKLVPQRCYGSSILVLVSECVSRFSEKNDARCTWQFKDGVPSFEDATNNVKLDDLIASDLLSYFTNPFAEVRLTVASLLPRFISLIQHSHEKFSVWLFETFKQTLDSLFIVEDMTEEEIEDERINRSVSGLLALTFLASSSVSARRPSLYLLFRLVREKNLKNDLAKKALILIADTTKVENASKFFQENHHYVLWKWNSEYGHLKNFPWHFLYHVFGENQCKEVFWKYAVTILLHKQNQDELSDAQRQLNNKPLADIVKECFPEIMSLLLPRLCIRDTNCFDTEPSDVHASLVTILSGNEKVEELMCDYLPEVIVAILETLHEPSYVLTSNSGLLSEFVALRFNKGIVLNTLLYLQTSIPQPDIPLIVYLCEVYPNHVQKILLELYIRAREGSTLDAKLEAFQRYVLFCDVILEHYGRLSSMWHFFTKTILFDLLCNITDDERTIPLSLSSLHFLQRFISVTIEVDKSTIAAYVSLVVAKLIPLAKCRGSLGEACLSLLRCLFVDHRKVVEADACWLDPLPDASVFEEMHPIFEQLQNSQPIGGTGDDDRDSVMFKMKQFLVAGQKSPHPVCRLQGLKQLRKHLSDVEFKERLMLPREYHQRLNSSSFGDLFRQLICALIKLTRTPDREVCMEAACCLGEIGLVDLHSPVLLQSAVDADDEYSCRYDSAETSVAVKLLHLLSDCVVDADVDVRREATNALYSLLSSKRGQHYASQLNASQREFLKPFLKLEESSDGENLYEQNGDHHHGFKEKMSTLKRTLCYAAEGRNCYNYKRWITDVVCSLLDTFPPTSYFHSLVPLCRLKVTCCESLLRYLFHYIMNISEDAKNAVVGYLNGFFKYCCDNHVPAEDVGELKASVHQMLDVVLFIWHNQKKLHSCDLDYMKISEAARANSFHLTSLLFVELRIDTQIRRHDIRHDGSVLIALDEIRKIGKVEADGFLRIVQQAFEEIGDADAISGYNSEILRSGNADDEDALLRYYQHVGNWHRVMELCSHQLSLRRRCNDNVVTSFVKSLDHCTLPAMQYVYLSSLGESSQLNDAKLTDALYECACKMNNWDLPAQLCSSISAAPSTFGYCQYAALMNIREKNYDGAGCFLNLAREEAVLPYLREISLESTKNLYPFLSKLQCLQELEEFVKCDDDKRRAFRKWWHSYQMVGGRNQQQQQQGVVDLEHAQRIYTQRLNLLLLNSDVDRNTICDFHLKTAAIARDNGWHSFAGFCLSSLKRSMQESGGYNDAAGFRVIFEDAKLLWQQNDTTAARCVMKGLLDGLEGTKQQQQQQLTDSTSANWLWFHSTCLRTYGSWLLKGNLENADVVFEKYFSPALKKMEGSRGNGGEEEHENRVATYDCMAEFFESRYRHVCDYMKTEIYAEFVRNAGEPELRRDSILGGGGGLLSKLDQKVHEKTIHFKNKQIKCDKLGIQETQGKRQEYLLSAARYWLKCLKQRKGEQDLRVFRIISLWLENKGCHQLQDVMLPLEGDIPSYKFICALPQLIPHIGDNSNSTFTKIINRLIERCAIEHPHHTLHLLLMLANFSKDKEIDRDAVGATARKKKPSAIEGRYAAAKRLLDKLKRENKNDKLCEIIRQMELLAEAYIHFAYSRNIRSGVLSGGGIRIPASEKITKISNFNSIFCFTLNVPVKRNADYDSVIGVRSFEKVCYKLGGISQPSKIICNCTDGQQRTQLLKSGEDDLRQDSTMLQVFSIMNELLTKNAETSQRDLLLRTYKVVPLSQRSGVIEWCINTCSLSDYLVGSDRKTGAHLRYRPTDMTPSEARQKLNGLEGNERLREYMYICNKLQPVFRYFFTEKFPLPVIWFQKKLSYIHSLATSSAVGYVLGLGDRHPHNILIDELTAELIHIDFGIAFEQGSLLPTPEAVPFRLTRDIEDGMGVFALDGVFRKCCEKTMDVLRDNKDIIKTIIEVFLYDPLYMWVLTAEKAAAVQNHLVDNNRLMNNLPDNENSSVEFNRMAERAILRVKLKLEGCEEEDAPCTVEGHVNRLIQKARDARNLSRMYVGWQAYL